jgi:hypothetical protein
MASDQQHFDYARRWQEEFDRTLEDLGSRAQAPTLGQKRLHSRVLSYYEANVPAAVSSGL